MRRKKNLWAFEIQSQSEDQTYCQGKKTRSSVNYYTHTHTHTQRYSYIYILSSTASFVVSQHFSVDRHVGRLNLGSKPAQIYVKFSIIQLSHQANHVSLGIIRHYVVAFVYLHFFPYWIPECSIHSKSFALCEWRSLSPSPECSTPMRERIYILGVQVVLQRNKLAFERVNPFVALKIVAIKSFIRKDSLARDFLFDGLVSLFNGISTFVGYLMPNLFS